MRDFVQILEVKRYSPNTISAYNSTIKLAEQYFKKPLNECTDNELHKYFHLLVTSKNASVSYQKQMVMALKLYFKEVHDRSVHLEFLLPERSPEKIPVIISKQEMLKILNSISNIKHKAMVSLLYSSGMRIGELLDLKISEIDSGRMILTIRQGKGKKDRIVPLAQSILPVLRTYYTEYKPRNYLFEGPKSSRYSSSSFNAVLKKAAKKAKVEKSISAHTLRHSYATHLLEQGTDVRVIQKLLGHRSIKTTMVYTKVAETTILGVTSPLDTL